MITIHMQCWRRYLFAKKSLSAKLLLWWTQNHHAMALKPAYQIIFLFNHISNAIPLFNYVKKEFSKVLSQIIKLPSLNSCRSSCVWLFRLITSELVLSIKTLHDQRFSAEARSAWNACQNHNQSRWFITLSAVLVWTSFSICCIIW